MKLHLAHLKIAVNVVSHSCMVFFQFLFHVYYGTDSDSDRSTETLVGPSAEMAAHIHSSITAEEIDMLDEAALPPLFLEQLQSLKSKADDMGITHSWAVFVWKFLYICFFRDCKLQNREQAMEA